MPPPSFSSRPRPAAVGLLLPLLLAGSVGCQRGCAGPSRTGRFDSRVIPARAGRLEIVQRYLRPPTPVEDAAFLVDFHDNGGGLVPGPSDWSLRFALRVAPDRAPAWTAGYEAEPASPCGAGPSAPDLAWGIEWAKAAGWGDLRTAPRLFCGAHGFRAVFEPEGVILILDRT